MDDYGYTPDPVFDLQDTRSWQPQRKGLSVLTVSLIAAAWLVVLFGIAYVLVA